MSQSSFPGYVTVHLSSPWHRPAVKPMSQSSIPAHVTVQFPNHVTVSCQTHATIRLSSPCQNQVVLLISQSIGPAHVKVQLSNPFHRPAVQPIPQSNCPIPHSPVVQQCHSPVVQPISLSILFSPWHSPFVQQCHNPVFQAMSVQLSNPCHSPVVQPMSQFICPAHVTDQLSSPFHSTAV